jgi:hypothetical protein
MARSLPNRLTLTLALATGAAASALAAAPALATEGPAAPPPAPTLPSGIAPPSMGPAVPAPLQAPQQSKASRVVQRLRVSPRRVRRGQRARVRISLATPSRLQIVLSRTRGHKRVRPASITLPARGRTVSLRLPKRAHGHLLRADRYRIAVRAIDASGTKSAPVRTSMRVRRARR